MSICSASADKPHLARSRFSACDDAVVASCANALSKVDFMFFGALALQSRRRERFFDASGRERRNMRHNERVFSFRDGL